MIGRLAQEHSNLRMPYYYSTERKDLKLDILYTNCYFVENCFSRFWDVEQIILCKENNKVKKQHDLKINNKELSNELLASESHIGYD